MAVGQDTKGAFLAFVTRALDGEIKTSITRLNEDTRKQEKEEVDLENPVIVFFPNRTSQVMSAKYAERLGYLSTPSVVNMNTVDDAESPAGQLKFGLTDEARYNAWMMLEQHIISRCMAKGGHPVPREVDISDESLFFKKPATFTNNVKKRSAEKEAA